MPGRTVILTTGLGMGLLQPAVQLARALAPSMVVLEDVDLIAEERGRPGGAGPLLFELLNEMDGLRDDGDIIFALTTNRPEILEPALAARPGRIDLVVELPLPDEAGGAGCWISTPAASRCRTSAWDAIVAQTAGATPAYIKELLRKAAVLAATEGDTMVVTGAHVEAALAELAEGGRLAQRLLGFHPAHDPTTAGTSWPAPPTGFPTSSVMARGDRPAQ